MKRLFASRKVATRVIYRAFSDLAGKGIFFLITVAAAHRLSTRAFGVFAIATTLGWMIGVATDFGSQLHMARAVARRPGSGLPILRAWLGLRLWAGGAAIAIVAAGAWWWPAGGGSRTAILLFTLVYVGSGLIEFLHYFYRALSRTDVESGLVLGQRFATLILAGGVLLWHPDLAWLAAAMLLPVAATLVVSVRLAMRLGSEAAGARSPTLEPAPAVVIELRRELLPLGAGIVLSALYFRIDVFLVGLWSGTDAVALYSAVFRLIEALRLFPAAVLAVVLPTLVRADGMGPLRRISGALLAFSVPASALLWTAAGGLVPLLFGSRYAASVHAFQILVICLPLYSLNYALTHQLIAWDGERAYAWICAIALVANLALNARLIPALSIDGAAWATLWTEVVVSAGCGWSLWARHARSAPATAAVSW